MRSTALAHPDPAYRDYGNDSSCNQTAKRYTRSWRLAPPPAATRCTLPAAAGLVVAGGGVLLVPQRQARRVHHAGAADGVPGAGAVAARPVAQAVGAAAGIRIRGVDRDRGDRARRRF